MTDAVFSFIFWFILTNGRFLGIWECQDCFRTDGVVRGTLNAAFYKSDRIQLPKVN